MPFVFSLFPDLYLTPTIIDAISPPNNPPKCAKLFISLEINPINNNITNNNMLITRKLNTLNDKETEQRKQEPAKVSKIELANNIIQEYFETGVLPEFDKNIKETIISILKNDLDSDENDIEKLLEKAREKVSFEVDKSTVLELFIKEGNKVKNGKPNN